MVSSLHCQGSRRVYSGKVPLTHTDGHPTIFPMVASRSFLGVDVGRVRCHGCFSVLGIAPPHSHSSLWSLESFEPNIQEWLQKKASTLLQLLQFARFKGPLSMLVSANQPINTSPRQTGGDLIPSLTLSDPITSYLDCPTLFTLFGNFGSLKWNIGICPEWWMAYRHLNVHLRLGS